MSAAVVRSIALALAVAVAGSGCWMGKLQTARTTPKGHLRAIVGDGFIYNELISERKEAGGLALGFGNFPPHLGVRLGVTDWMDVGLVEFGLLGLQADAKVNVLPRRWPAALSLSAGLGFAAGMDDSGGGLSRKILQLPFSLMASWDFLRHTSTMTTPYVGVSWLATWVWGYGTDSGSEPGGNAQVIPGSGPTQGDHALQATIGVAITVTQGGRLFVEYDYLHLLLDDTGDNYAMVDNHVFLVGVAGDIRLWGEEPRRMPSAPAPRTLPPPPPPPRVHEPSPVRPPAPSQPPPPASAGRPEPVQGSGSADATALPAPPPDTQDASAVR